MRFGGGSHSGEALGPLGTMVPQNDSSKGGAAYGPRCPCAIDSFLGPALGLLFAKWSDFWVLCGLFGESIFYCGFLALKILAPVFWISASRSYPFSPGLGGIVTMAFQDDLDLTEGRRRSGAVLFFSFFSVSTFLRFWAKRNLADPGELRILFRPGVSWLRSRGATQAFSSTTSSRPFRLAFPWQFIFFGPDPKVSLLIWFLV